MSYLCVHCPCAAESEDSGYQRELRVVGDKGRWPQSSCVMGRTWASCPAAATAITSLSLALSLDWSRPSMNFTSTRSWIKTWSVKPLPVPDAPSAEHIIGEKVITLGQGVLGWVDFRKGVVVCDVLREPLDVRFIPLPTPMPENRERLKEFHPGDPAMRLRDVTFSNGMVKFVEVEQVSCSSLVKGVRHLFDNSITRLPNRYVLLNCLAAPLSCMPPPAAVAVAVGTPPQQG
ncbi:hypothetical protein C2845_PM01G04630 [Panicum miliaceum]|uniref:DUF1618 domain-containing protein n=1 Tax=Panicum miliaceum TaxID=4540 RepID=A0A3L6TJ49_PANMI|nr:hypothetical protein C2845_PM01G04630 [Panicum miliaceum]